MSSNATGPGSDTKPATAQAGSSVRSNRSPKPDAIARREYLSELRDELGSTSTQVSVAVASVPVDADWPTIYGLEKALIRQATPAQLARRAWIIRNRYRQTAGETKYAIYMASNPPSLPSPVAQSAVPAVSETPIPTSLTEAVRADLLELHGEIVRESIFSDAMEGQRALLSRRLAWITLAIVFDLGLLLASPWLTTWAQYAAILFVVLTALAWIGWSGFVAWQSRRKTTAAVIAVLLAVCVTAAAQAQSNAGTTKPAPTAAEKAGTVKPSDQGSDRPAIPPFTLLTTLTMVAMTGFLGGAFSVIRRVQAPSADGDATRNLQKLVAVESYIVLAPISGAIAALVLYAFFCGNLLDAGVFPKVTCSGAKSPTTFLDFLQHSGPQSCADQGKVLVWSFIAGFAERLVPDAIDRLTKATETK